MNNDTRYVYVGLATVLIVFFTVIAVLFSVASGPVAVITVITTTTTSIVDELVPAVSMTAPSPVLTEKASYFVLDTRNRTESGWINSLSDADLIFYVRAVCADFDQSLWFWDMYEKRLNILEAEGWASEDAALQIVMGDGVTALCAYNQDRLPSELLGD